MPHGQTPLQPFVLASRLIMGAQVVSKCDRSTAIAGRDASRVWTPAMMSMIGFAARPGTAVLPMCSIGPTSQGASSRDRTAASSSNRATQAESYETISIGASVDVTDA
jgi:hypothetical protein